MRRLVLATGNPDKTREIADIFRPRDLSILPVTRLQPDWSVEETADTLTGNALLKARHACVAVGETTIADDTGLFVDALAGAPGVRSSRYAGPEATYEDNVRTLLEALRGRVGADRRASFRTVVALVRPSGDHRVFEGRLEGRILEAPRGGEGFGYDPVFFVPKEGKTLAELSMTRKNKISHRFRAFRAAADYLEAHPEWLAESGGGSDRQIDPARPPIHTLSGRQPEGEV